MKTAAPGSLRRPIARESPIQKVVSRTSEPRPCAAACRKTRAAVSLLDEKGDSPQPCQSARCQFHRNSLVAQLWLDRLQKYIAKRYVGRTGTSDRALQAGYAWRSFSKLFFPLSEIASIRLFENLLRFSDYGIYPPARSFFLAYAPLAFEHDASGEYIGPGVWTPEAGTNEAAQRVRRTLKRWCDWLEALAHLQVRELQQGEASRLQLDKTIIVLWPLVKRHNWSYHDLLTIVRWLLGGSSEFPLQNERHFASYCWTALGLRKAGPENAVQDGPIAALEVAERLTKFLAVVS